MKRAHQKFKKKKIEWWTICYSIWRNRDFMVLDGFEDLEDSLVLRGPLLGILDACTMACDDPLAGLIGGSSEGRLELEPIEPVLHNVVLSRTLLWILLLSHGARVFPEGADLVLSELGHFEIEVFVLFVISEKISDVRRLLFRAFFFLANI